MAKKLFINPPKLFRWLPAEQKFGVLLDLEPDFIDPNTLRIDLNIAFRPIAFKRGIIRKRDYYVGSTGARIVFKTLRGRITEFTTTKPAAVTYKQTYKRSRKAEVKIGPTIETQGGTSAGIGDVTFGKGDEREFETSFTGAEKMLQEVVLDDTIEWDFAYRSGKAFRDYVIGNLCVYVESSVTGKAGGTIVVSPSDVTFFDADRRPIEGGWKSLAMQFAVWLEGVNVSDDPVEVRYEER